MDLSLNIIQFHEFPNDSELLNFHRRPAQRKTKKKNGNDKTQIDEKNYQDGFGP